MKVNFTHSIMFHNNENIALVMYLSVNEFSNMLD